MAALRRAADGARFVAAKHDMTTRFTDALSSVLILEGWAHRSCLLADGRRQISEIHLPGDVLVSSSFRDAPDENVTAITGVTCCSLPAASVAACPGLMQALQASREDEERLLRRQIVRLGRLGALKRIIDWLLDLYERLDVSGSCRNEMMPLPLTQEIMADALGLTSVHVNRTLATIRREGLFTVQGAHVVFLDRSRCRSIIGK